MPLVYSCLLPHSPILSPGIASAHAHELQSTLIAAHNLGQELAESRPDIILLVSPHGVINDQAFTLNTALNFKGDLSEFGDLGTKISYPGCLSLHQVLQQGIGGQHFEAISHSQLDYGTAVSLTFLPSTSASLLPLYSAGLSLEEHYRFGQQLANILQSQSQRIALVVSGDLSHRLNRRSPAGYSPKAKWFDKRVLKALETKNHQELLRLDQNLITEIEECGLRPIMILLGLLSQLQLQTTIASYEHPVGVGWVVAKFTYQKSG
jgi:aromatic ring-opening dioxygenase LigB subunit